jgi:hypothetical protein
MKRKRNRLMKTMAGSQRKTPLKMKMLSLREIPRL